MSTCGWTKTSGNMLHSTVHRGPCQLTPCLPEYRWSEMHRQLNLPLNGSRRTCHWTSIETRSLNMIHKDRGWLSKCGESSCSRAGDAYQAERTASDIVHGCQVKGTGPALTQKLPIVDNGKLLSLCMSTNRSLRFLNSPSNSCKHGQMTTYCPAC